jgi:hypothetical protein
MQSPHPRSHLSGAPIDDQHGRQAARNDSRKDQAILRPLTPRRAIVVAALGLALLGAGCSSNDGDPAPAAPAVTQPPAAAAGMTFGPACSAVPSTGPGSLNGMAEDPVATAASNNPQLSTLVTAVKQAGLVDTLNSANGITVFAPTNDAFAALPKAALNEALADPKGLLTTVLTYHVVQGELTRRCSRGPTRLWRAAPCKSAATARTSRSTASPVWSAATCRPPTQPSTSSTGCSYPRADHHTTQPGAATGITVPVAAPRQGLRRIHRGPAGRSVMPDRMAGLPHTWSSLPAQNSSSAARSMHRASGAPRQVRRPALNGMKAHAGRPAARWLH